MQKVLIVFGGWPWHYPGDGAKVLAGLLAEDGFEPTITEDYTMLAKAADYDLVVPIITNDQVDPATIMGLTAAVRNGTALGGYHCCMATSFRSSVQFHFMTGVQWVAHPGDETARYRVNVTRPDDPVMAGIKDFDYVSEQYYVHYDPTNEILATTTFTGEYDPVTKGAVMPVVFKRRFGKGRIFWSALGHHPDELSHPEGQKILRRGLKWAARTEEERPRE